jgi:hypothetical protein
LPNAESGIDNQLIDIRQMRPAHLQYIGAMGSQRPGRYRAGDDAGQIQYPHP